jgi:hypothetical protein
MVVFTLIVGVVVAQTMFAQDKPIENKAGKVVKIKKNSNKECSAKMECCKGKKCCDNCTGDSCTGVSCAKCAECKKEYGDKCEMGSKEKYAMDSTGKTNNQDVDNHKKNKTILKKEAEMENKK